MSDVNRYVNLASTSGGDGTTNATSGSTRAFASWREAVTTIGTAIPNFVSADVRVILHCTGSAPDSDASIYTFPTITMDATRYLLTRVEAGSRHPGYYSTSCYSLQSAAVVIVSQVNPFCQFEDLLVTSTLSGGAVLFSPPLAMPGNLKFRRCVLHTTQTASTVYTAKPIAWLGVDTGKNLDLINCVISGRWGMALDMQYSGTINLYHNSVYGADVYGLFVDSCVSLTAKQNVVQRYAGSTGPAYVFGSNSSQTTNRNVSDDATSPDSSYRSVTATYVNAGIYNLQPASGDTVLKNAGVDLSSDSPIAVSDDILGNARATFDIGAWIAAASGGGGAGFRRYILNQ